MSVEKKCISCGALLADDAPEGSVCLDCYEAEQAQGTVAAPEEFELPQAYPTPPTPITSTPSFVLPPAQPMFETIGDFEVIDKLGQGGMGAVYRARQRSFDRLVALKILPAQFEEDEEYVARFQREAAVAASLHHANLVRVYSSGQADGCHFIAMELVEGENLRQRLKRGGMTPVEALRICADVARGLQCGWDKAQLVHRDIKPSNIYLSAEGEVKLGDLGLAKSLLGNTTGLTQTGAAMGTPHYMSPEQARGEKTLDFRADIYSLGCTLFELITGQPPYSGSDGLTIINQHLNAPLPAILKIMPGCPMPLVRLIGKMLKKHRNERHPSYTDLIAELEWVSEQLQQGEALSQGPRYSAIAQTMPPKATPSSTPSVVTASVPPARKKPPVVLYVGIGVAALALAGALVFTLGSKPKNRPALVDETPAAEAPAASAASSDAPAKASGPARWQTLFNGFNSSGWLQPSGLPATWQVVERALIGGAREVRSREQFQDHAVHLEFTLGPGVGADNAIFLQNRYGIALADSSGQPAGTILGGQAPTENAGTGPDKLQTLDVVFHAARFNDSGRKTASAKVSVVLNGKLIHDQQEIAKASEGGDAETSDPGALRLAANGNPVRYHKVLVLPLDGQSDAEALRLAQNATPFVPELPKTTVTLGASTAQWTPVTEQLIQGGSVKGASDGWFSFQEGYAGIPEFRAHNVGVRYKLRKIPADQANRAPQPTLRQVKIGNISSGYQLQFAYDNGALGMIVKRLSAPEHKMYGLGGRTALPDFSADAEHTVEFYAVGPELIARCDGKVLTTKIDREASDLSTAVAFHNASTGQLKDLEVINLDGLPEVDALLIAKTGGWRKYEFAKLDPAELQKKLPESKMEGDLFHMRGFKSWIIPDSNLQNISVRTTFVWRSQGTDFKVRLRGRGGDNISGESLVGYLSGRTLTLRGGDSKEPELAKFSVPSSLKEDEEATLQVTAIGSRMFLHLNGELIGEAKDVPLLKAGQACIHTKDVLIRNVEILNLDGLPEAEALKYASGTSSGAFRPLVDGRTFAPAAAETKVLTSWENLLADPEVLAKGHQSNDGFKLAGSATVERPGKNGAIRSRVVLGSMGNNLALIGRKQGNRWYQARLSSNGLGGFIQYVDTTAGLYGDVSQAQKTPLAQSVGADESIEAELRISGDRLYLLLNGTCVFEGVDNRLDAGRWGLSVATANSPLAVQSLEYRGLDGAAAPTPNPAPSSASSSTWPRPSEWIDATDEVRNSGLKEGILQVEGDWLTAASNYHWYLIGGTRRMTDSVVKVIFSNRAGAKIRSTDDERGYLAEISGRSAALFYGSSAGREKLASVDLGDGWKTDGTHELVFTAQGTTLEIWIDGKRVITAQDARLTEGKMKVTSVADGKVPPTRIKSVKYGELTGVASSGAPAAATEVLSFGGHRYQYIPGSVSWDEAKAKAEALGGHLATVTSREEDERLAALLKGLFPIGGEQVIVLLGGFWQDGAWRWATGEPFTYQHWREGEPNDTSKPHPYLNYWSKMGVDFGWADDSRDSTSHIRGFLIEWDNSGSPSDAAPVANSGKEVLSLVELPRDVVKGTWSRTAEGLLLDQANGFGACELPYEPPAEYDLEVDFTPKSDGKNVNVHLPTASSSVIWKLNAHGQTPPIYGFDMLDRRMMPGRGEAMTGYPVALEAGRRYTTRIEVRRTGLRAFLDGQEVVSWTGDLNRLSTENAAILRNERRLAVGSFGRKVLFSRVVVKEVGASANPGAAIADPSAATKDAPYVNSLGMKLVPVPIAGGPTNGQRVLFSIWETRVQDYLVFTKELGKSWSPFSGAAEPPMPASLVSWTDATNFCRWLTEQERKKGLLVPGWAYRLPLDHEWSCAAGIGDREDPRLSPQEKLERMPSVWLWGTGERPAAGFANVADDKLKADVNATSQFRVDSFFDRYDDGFKFAAPVGRFSPNAFGLYDLAGNVSELCEDFFRQGDTARLQRGGSFLSGPYNLRAAMRTRIGPDYASPQVGFRVVLAPEK